MNTLSMRDHGDDNARRAVEAALIETYEPPMDADIDVEYELASDDAPDLFTDMQHALVTALKSGHDPVAKRTLKAHFGDMLSELADEEFMYLHESAVADSLVDDRLTEGETPPSHTQIGESDPVIGESVAVDPQAGTDNPMYTIYCLPNDRSPEGSYYFFADLTKATEKLIECLGDVMRDDPTHDYWEMITDAYMESPEGRRTVAGMAIGFTFDFTDRESNAYTLDPDRYPAFDPTILPRGVYLFTSEDTISKDDRMAIDNIIRTKTTASMTMAGWMFDAITPETETTHYHVVSFFAGYLNDSDSGPLETAEDAISYIEDRVNTENEWEDTNETGERWVETLPMWGQIKRYERGTWVMAAEKCDDPCESEEGDEKMPEDDNIWYMVTNHNDTNQTVPSLAMAIGLFQRELRDLASNHPTCMFATYYDESVMFGVELVSGDAKWTTDREDGAPRTGLFIEVSPSQRIAYEKTLCKMIGHEIPPVRSMTQLAREHGYLQTKAFLGIDTGNIDLTCNEMWSSESLYIASRFVSIDYNDLRAVDMAIALND